MLCDGACPNRPASHRTSDLERSPHCRGTRVTSVKWRKSESLSRESGSQKQELTMANILSQRWLLSRRHVLRGLGVSLALPLFDCMRPLLAADKAARP